MKKKILTAIWLYVPMKTSINWLSFCLLKTFFLHTSHTHTHQKTIDDDDTTNDKSNSFLNQRYNNLKKRQ